MICQTVVMDRTTGGMHQCSIDFDCDCFNLGSIRVKRDLVDMVMIDCDACLLLKNEKDAKCRKVSLRWTRHSNETCFKRGQLAL